jgi:hypothetical protein
MKIRLIIMQRDLDKRMKMREETCSDCEFREDDIYCYSWSNAKIELEEIYEAAFGDNAINKYSHAELIERLYLLRQNYTDFYEGKEGCEHYMDTGAYGDYPND